MYNWSRPKAHEASKSRQTRSCCKMRNLHRGPLGLHLSLRVWKTLEAGLETWKMVQTPQSSLKGNQNLFWILGTQCKAPFAPFHPKIKKKKNLKRMYLHLVILLLLLLLTYFSRVRLCATP